MTPVIETLDGTHSHQENIAGSRGLLVQSCTGPKLIFKKGSGQGVR